MKRFVVCFALVALGTFGCGGGGTARDAGSSDAAAGVPRLNAGRVPADLQDLVPLAQRWGVADDVLRPERVNDATEAERAELRAAFAPRQARITEWLDSFGSGVMPDEAAAFMYTQLAIEEMR